MRLYEKISLESAPSCLVWHYDGPQSAVATHPIISAYYCWIRTDETIYVPVHWGCVTGNARWLDWWLIEHLEKAEIILVVAERMTGNMVQPCSSKR